jgi:CubicO group peptidase (beta-lactamase class C family)
MFPLPQFTNLDRSILTTAFPQIEAIFKKFIEQQRSPGVSYGVVVDGELVYSGGMGIQNIVSKIPVTPDSVFRIASMTKSFTAMAIIKLRDEGRLRLDDPVEQHVPELVNLTYPTKDSAPITVRQLLTMGAGLPQDDPWADRQLALAEDQFTAWLGQNFSFSNPPGIKYEYSNLGYAILGRVVSNVSGIRYQDYVKQHILDPLGMTSTTFDIKAVAPDRLAMGYRREGDSWAEETPLADGAFASIGGLFTTITDFAKYMAYLLSAFPARDDAESGPVRRSSLREMQQHGRQRLVYSSRSTPDVPASVVSDGYGYGLAAGLDSLLGYSVSHGGGLPGYGTFYRILPDCNVGIVAFSNLTYTTIALSVNEAFAVLHKTGGLKVRTVPASADLVGVQQRLMALYNDWTDEAVKGLATESFFLDMPIENRRQQFEQLRQNFGKCRSVTAIEAENALRGRWMMQCQRGRIELLATMAPVVPPKLQWLHVISIKPLSPALKKTTAQVVQLIQKWDEKQARNLFAKTIQPKVLSRQFDALRVQYGKLKLGHVLEGDGQTQARVRLVGEYGIVDMKLVVDLKSKKISEIVFTRPRETAFVS